MKGHLSRVDTEKFLNRHLLSGSIFFWNRLLISCVRPTSQQSYLSVAALAVKKLVVAAVRHMCLVVDHCLPKDWIWLFDERWLRCALIEVKPFFFLYFFLK